MNKVFSINPVLIESLKCSPDQEINELEEALLHKCKLTKGEAKMYIKQAKELIFCNHLDIGDMVAHRCIETLSAEILNNLKNKTT